MTTVRRLLPSCLHRSRLNVQSKTSRLHFQAFWIKHFTVTYSEEMCTATPTFLLVESGDSAKEEAGRRERLKFEKLR